VVEAHELLFISCICFRNANCGLLLSLSLSCMEQSPPREVESSSASQEIIPRPACYRVHKRPPLIHITGQINPVHTFTPYFLKDVLIFLHLRLGLTNGLFPLRFPTKMYMHCLPTHAICPAYLMLLNYIIRILCEEYKWRVQNFHYPVFCSFLFHHLLSSPFSHTLNLCPSLGVTDQISHPYKA
jgi:hypothetical protein